VREVAGLLGECRLVTATGPGGAGNAADYACDIDDALQLARQGQQIPADIPGWIARYRCVVLTKGLAKAGDLAAAGRVCADGLARSRDNSNARWRPVTGAGPPPAGPRRPAAQTGHQGGPAAARAGCRSGASLTSCSKRAWPRLRAGGARDITANCNSARAGCAGRSSMIAAGAALCTAKERWDRPGWS